MNLDLNLTESEEILKTAAVNFIKRDVPKETLEALHESDTGLNEALWKKVVDLGWLGIIIPEEYGGTGYPLTTAGVLFEALGSAPLPGPCFTSGILGSLIIREAGRESQKKEILPQMAEGRTVLSTVLTEAELGWHSEVRAEKKGGEYILTGGRLMAPEAMSATHLIVPVRTGGNNSLTLFLVDKKMNGVSLRRLPGYLMGRTFDIKLESVTLPAEAIIGQEDQGHGPLLSAVRKSTPVLCAYKVGGSQAVFNLAVEHSRVRVQFGQPVGRFQRVQDMIIEINSQVDAARWTTYEALWKLDSQGLIPEAVHLAKAVASEAYWQSCNQAHRAISGISYSTEHPLSLHTRASRYLYNYLGEPAYHKQQLAKLILA